MKLILFHRRNLDSIRSKGSQLGKIIEYVQDGKPADTEPTAIALFVRCPFLFDLDIRHTE